MAANIVKDSEFLNSFLVKCGNIDYGLIFMTTALDSYAERAREIFETQVKRSSEALSKESAVVIVFPKIGRFLIADTPEQAIKARSEFMEQYVGVDVGPSFTFNLLGNPTSTQ